VTHFTSVCEAFGSIPEKPFVGTSISSHVTSAVTSLALVNCCLFRTLFSHGNRKTSGSDKSGEYSEHSKAITLWLARYFWPLKTNMQEHCNAEETRCFIPIFLTFSLPFWNKFIVDNTLSINENLQHNLAFNLVQAEPLFPRT
jgi:hypothetical protein